MPNIQPFEGLRYNLAQIGSLSDVVAPPYDVIDPALQDALYEKHPNNVVRLILNKMLPTDDEQNNRYTRSARELKNWKEEGVLQKDSKPAIYVYHEIFTVGDKEYTRKGFMCGCEAVPFGEGMVFPHEITMSGPKLDRLMLTTACKTNFSQIFGLYPDEKNEVQNLLEEATLNLTPLEATDHLGVIHRMWVVDDQEVVAKVVEMMGPKPIFIADGHHRYETACNYRKQVREQGLLTTDHPANHVLMVCVAMEDPGLIVLPTHRLFRNVKEFSQEDLFALLGDSFAITTVGEGPTAAAKAWTMIEMQDDQGTMALYTGKDRKWSLIRQTEAGRAKMDEVAAERQPEWRALGVAILHRLVIDKLLGLEGHDKPKYVHEVAEVVENLENKADEFPLAALVSPATVAQIQELSLVRERMPAKSTYFYPKLITGFVFKPLD
ncbi:MAG: DUF1015 domain-containing protein [Thermoguttaceae bacterium]|nr:DUF1015 domain-containing protein [Thermoguttaceae bacterium]MBQ8284882.1 DUF1015 domain-containing protein [Thermoguttaceae bacterium]